MLSRPRVDDNGGFRRDPDGDRPRRLGATRGRRRRDVHARRGAGDGGDGRGRRARDPRVRPGLVRLHRVELAAGERDTRHWHVDYLLGHPDAAVEVVATTPAVDAECAVSGALDGERVPGFGVSDCVCDSHLVSARRRDDLLWTVERAHAARR